MSASGYTAWSVTAGEVPTTAFWNILGSNDASFNTGNGFNDNIITSRHIEVQQAWQTPAYQGTWVNYDLTYGPAGYYKDTLGIVHLRGLIKSGTANTTAFTLPAGMRPEIRSLFVGDSNSAESRIDIGTDGQVIPVNGTPAAWVSLNNIHFRAFS